MRWWPSIWRATKGASPHPSFANTSTVPGAAGLHVTVHAGEAVGPESIWWAIRDLGAERIGHAVRAQEDPDLLDHMLEHGIGIEANLTSNVQTSSVPSYDEHPLKAYLEQGLQATLNTDDPTISGIDLAYEYRHAAPRAGLDEALVPSSPGTRRRHRFSRRRRQGGPAPTHRPAGDRITVLDLTSTLPPPLSSAADSSRPAEGQAR